MTPVFFRCPGVRCLEEYIWRNELSKDGFAELNDFALKMPSMFENTYVCESTPSAMKQVKSKNRNRITNEKLDHSRRLATTNTGIDKGGIVSEKPRPQASH